MKSENVLAFGMACLLAALPITPLNSTLGAILVIAGVLSIVLCINTDNVR